MSRKRYASNRREFLKSIGIAAAAGAGLPAWFAERERGIAAAEQSKSPNDRPRIALVGAGGRGMGDARNAANYGDVVAVCDVDENHVRRGTNQFKGAEGYKDFRKMMERDDIDVVVNGTPDHWHTLVNLAAVNSGKDVYSEKPLTLTIDEGKRLVEAVRSNKRVLQTGSQQRSDGRFRLACELVRNGRLGKLQRIRVFLPAGLREGPFAPQPVPEQLDWDFWLGQAPMVDYTPKRCHTTFRYFYDYSGGTMTDWGAHHNDIAFWATGLEGPDEIEGEPLAMPIPGGYTAHSEYRLTYRYANGIEHICESETYDNIFGGKVSDPPPGEFRHGIQFIGPEGWIYVTRGNMQASDKALIEEPLPEDAERLYDSNNHMGNFFECVKSRKDPICDVNTGHRSASICHLGVIAIRLGRKLKWDVENEKFVGDEEAQSMVARTMRKPWTYDAI